jgi:hypothetical protein
MRLLEAHGITLLPEDTGGGALESAMRAGGQTLTLTEAGKMVLSSQAVRPTVIKTIKKPTMTTVVQQQYQQQKPTIVRLSSGVNAGVGKGTPGLRTVVRTVASLAGSTTGGGVVIKQPTNVLQQGVAVQSNKTPRIIKISPEQFAALKSGTKSINKPKFTVDQENDILQQSNFIGIQVYFFE